MKKYALPKILFFSILLFPFTGCDSNDEEDLQQAVGSFEIMITGATTESLNGSQASFGAATDPETGISGFTMTLGSGVASSHLISFLRKGGRPPAGAYALLDVDDNTDFDSVDDSDIFAIYTNGTDVYYSSGGSITITESTDNVIEGSINMTALSIVDNSNGVSLIGTFKAVGFDISG